MLPKLRKRHRDGWLGGWVPCSRSSVSLGYPGTTALLQEAGSGAEVYLDSGPGTGRARGEERRRDSERWELDTVRTGYDTNCVMGERDYVFFTDCYCERSVCDPALEILDP
jgi:hypothetical protein